MAKFTRRNELGCLTVYNTFSNKSYCEMNVQSQTIQWKTLYLNWRFVPVKQRF